MRRVIGSTLLVFALAVTLAGCKQGVGERCQVQSDCDDSLICVLPLSGNNQVGGTCEKTGTLDGGLIDEAAPIDALAQD